VSERAQDLLEEALAKDGGPGMMAAVVRGGDLLWTGAAGMADLELGVALTPGTRMRTGSVSKTLTAGLIARLVDAGKLGVDEDVRQHVPAFPDKGVVITPRHIAAHTSGIRHYDFANMFEANNVRVYERLDDALAIFAGDPLLAAPGTTFEYSSLAYNLLGVTAAAAAESSFGDALASWVTTPLGLADTMIDHPLAIIPRRTRFYTVVDGPAVINTYWRDSSDFYPSGGILSTASDLAVFTAAVFEGEFLSDASRALLSMEATLKDGSGVGYSFGWQVREVDGQRRYSHGGESNGVHAQVVYIPDLNMAVAGITNYNFWGQDLAEPAFFDLVADTLPRLFEPVVRAP
jgi:CubicO group peptidase (beta-lactamase class C family)